MTYLDKNTFSTVIESSPLVSIDLIVKNLEGEVLLGERLNRPAIDFWFVPGGRILKDEALAQAFKRLTLDELGKEFSIDQVDLIGPFDHFYDDNFFGDSFTTHYVAIGYKLKLSEELSALPCDIQHQSYKWMSIDELKASELVHENTKKYFS
jgi:colanic acid biosynthesis protein WcaH